MIKLNEEQKEEIILAQKKVAKGYFYDNKVLDIEIRKWLKKPIDKILPYKAIS